MRLSLTENEFIMTYKFISNRLSRKVQNEKVFSASKKERERERDEHALKHSGYSNISLSLQHKSCKTTTAQSQLAFTCSKSTSGNTRKSCEICSKLTIKILERRQ